jgi:hypothetical protein
VSAEAAIEEVAPLDAEEITAEVAVPGLGNVTSLAYNLGPSSTNRLKVRLGSLNLTTDLPMVVLLQPRQFDNQDFNFPDQFAVQVITTARNSILVEVRRLDGTGGWGQNLRLDLLVVDRQNF